MARLDQFNVDVTINSVKLGTFDKQTGGALDSDEVKYKPGNMGAQIALGGSTTVDNLVVSRLYVLERDQALVPFLKGIVGKGSVTVGVQDLDIDGNPFGAARVYTGILKTLKFPEPDSEATTTASMIELTISSDGTIG